MTSRRSIITGFFLLCFILFAAKDAHAQSGRNYHYFTFDGEGKLDFILNQNVYGRPELKYRFKPGYSYGVGYGYDIGNRHKIQTGIRYTTGGQYYKDIFLGLEHVKEIELFYYQLPILYKFIVNRPSKTYRKDFQYILNAGVNLSYLSKANATYKIDDKTVDFYIFEAYNNPRYNEILENPKVTNPIDLYNRLDFSGYFGISVLYFVLDYVALELEVNGNYGFLDLNPIEWQIKNIDGQYSASHNAQFGTRLTLLYYIPFW